MLTFEDVLDRECAIDIMARSAFACEWADAVDRYDDVDTNLSGTEIFDVCPFDIMPDRFQEWATDLYEQLGANFLLDDKDRAQQTLQEWSEFEHHDPERLEHVIAMQAMGTGVGLDDHGLSGGILIPYMDCDHRLYVDRDEIGE